MFPSPGAEIIRNEAGEPIGWDVPGEPDWCDLCGGYHAGVCSGGGWDGEDRYEEEGQ